MKKSYPCVLMLLLALIASSSALAKTCINGIYYNIDKSKKQAEVTYEGTSTQESKKYKGDIVIPSTVQDGGSTYNVTSIDNDAFSGCSELTSISLPNSITTIKGWAFSKCDKLKTFHLPKSVTDAGGYILEGCSSLTSISVDKDNKTYDSRNNCNAIIHTATNELISGCQKTVIPNTVTRIGNGAFSKISTLITIDIPSSVISIGSCAFQNCSGLKTIKIPDSVISIEQWAFGYCTALESVSLPNSIDKIANNTFVNDVSLKSIVIPESVSSIDKWAIYCCNNLESVTILSTTPPVLGPKAIAFLDPSQTVEIHVPVGYRDIFLDNESWKNYKIIDDVVIPTPTAISSLQVSDNNTPTVIYDLSGRQLRQEKKGINIINRKKILVK